MDTRSLISDSENSCHPPERLYGTKNDLGALEAEQQELLNQKKIHVRRENEMYLRMHPEIQGLVSLILRHLLDKKPYNKAKIQELLSDFFNKPRIEIVEDLLNFFCETNQKGQIVEDLKKEIQKDTSDCY